MTAPRNDPRRRFFPARLAQQLPARTVELAVQLRKEGVSTAAAAAAAATAAATAAILGGARR